MSKKTKHTPGPWHFCIESGLFGRDTNTLKSAEPDVSDPIGVCLNVSDADAQLIAAAPELLKALVTLAETLTELNAEGKLPDSKNLNKAIQRAFDVSCKARGGD